ARKKLTLSICPPVCMLTSRNATCSGSSCCHQYRKDGYEPQHVPPLSVGLPPPLRGLPEGAPSLCQRVFQDQAAHWPQAPCPHLSPHSGKQAQPQPQPIQSFEAHSTPSRGLLSGKT
ncbi:unnamed protein product, partial [Ectocarpus sp. 8 AP-2014]